MRKDRLIALYNQFYVTTCELSLMSVNWKASNRRKTADEKADAPPGSHYDGL
jgi:hypothetical protein